MRMFIYISVIVLLYHLLVWIIPDYTKIDFIQAMLMYLIANEWYKAYKLSKESK